MPRCFFRYVLFLCLSFLLFACQSTQETPSTQIKKDAINDIVFEIKQSIVPKYYDFETKKIIHIDFEKIDSNYDEEPLFDEYIYTKIKQEVKAANQLDLDPYPNSTYDLRANIAIIKQPDADLKICNRSGGSITLFNHLKLLTC